MNQASGHLSDVQIQAYVADAAAPDAQKWLEAHISDCDSCRGRLLNAERIHLGLLEGDGMKRTPSPGCPAEETLQELAAGICAPQIAREATEHVSQCDYCGPLLARYLREFSDDLPAQDTEVLAQLKTSTTGWQQKFVRECMAAPKSRSEKSFLSAWWPKLSLAAAAAAVAVGIFIFRRSDDLNHAQQLMASAYAERRTTEMRLTGVSFAEYNPMPVVMGAQHGLDYQRPRLLELKSKLAEKLRPGSQLDPHWLEIEGRVALLENPGDAVEAEKVFKNAQAAGLNDPDLQIDLAASFFEQDSEWDARKEAAPSRMRFARTIDLLSQVLKNPGATREQKAVATFDLALAYEKTEMWDLAAATWKKYLDLEPSGDWSREAQKHLDKIKAEHAALAPGPQPYKDPAYLLGHAGDPVVQKNAEQFHEIALRSWLPRATETPGGDHDRALHRLATLFQQQHSDEWWNDFLKATGTADREAARSLSSALVNAENDLSYAAMLEARSAEQSFAQTHNLPGELAAQFAEVYALQRLLSGQICLQRAGRLWARLEGTRYHWLQGQVALELATCANLVSDYKTSDANVEMSRSLASQFHFEELLLRVEGIEAGIKRMRGDDYQAWEKGVEGLRLYWQDSRSAARLYQFYSVLRQCAKDKDLLYAAEALLRHSIEVVEADEPEDIGLRLLLYRRLANLLEQSQDGAAEADAEAAKAQDLLNQVPKGEREAETYASLTRIELADFDLRHQEPRRALETLEPVHSVLATHADYVTLDYYRVLGMAKLQLGELDEAAEAFQAGIGVAERSLSGMQDVAGRLAWTKATEGIYRGIVQVLLAKKNNAAALAVWEYSVSRSLARWDAEQSRPRSFSLDHVSHLPPLPPVSIPHLIYASFEDRLQVWRVQGSQVQSFSIAVTRKELRRKVQEFAEACSSPDQAADKIARESQALYALLLQPLLDALPVSSVVAVELDQPLSDLPIEALGATDGRFFGVEYAVVRSPGLFAENDLRAPLQPSLQDSFLVVDASPVSGNRYLPGHEKLTQTITEVYPGARVLASPEVTAANVRKGLGNSILFHFTGHGIRGASGAVLELGPDSFLTPQDFSPQSVRRLRLAVLAACSSGPGGSDLLDNTSLVGSLLAAKTADVMASHWNVESQSTSQLMNSFYHHLESEPAAQALRDARREMWRIHGHPYYWAGFSLIGRAS